MPGRKYSAGTQYRYGFNGQERSTEVNDDSYTAEFWQYDGRLGRRWNVDPKPVTGICEYSTFANNPINFSDAQGDTTVYFNSGGKQLFVSNNKGRNSAVLIADENIDKFNSTLNGFSNKHSLSNDKKLQKMGIIYDLKVMEDAYNTFHAKTKANDNMWMSFPGSNGEAQFKQVAYITNKRGDRTTLYSEYGSNLILGNNQVGLGQLYTSFSAFSLRRSDAPSEENVYGSFHIHSNKAQRYNVFIFTAPFLPMISEVANVTYPGPSPADTRIFSQMKLTGSKAPFNVMIDEKYIFFYTDKITMSINRSEKKVKEFSLGDYLQKK